LGGHLVSGHVDSFGTFLGAEDQGDSWRLSIGAPENILQLCIEKGSIAVDGISLTLVDVTNTGFSLWIIPETWKKTTLHLRKSGDRVNLEADQIGKYIRKSLEPWLGNAKEARLTDVMKRFAGG
ncbi:MAG: riboflavin synthase, partial [Candidatus Sumerlaeia bacterium]|nr:riboflavin synthase [Candidatus Sumerlaeia bacterium]